MPREPSVELPVAIAGTGVGLRPEDEDEEACCVAATPMPERGCKYSELLPPATGGEEAWMSEGVDSDDRCMVGTETLGGDCEEVDALYPDAIPMSGDMLPIAGGIGANMGTDGVGKDRPSPGAIFNAAANTASTDPVRAAARMASSWDVDITS